MRSTLHVICLLDRILELQRHPNREYKDLQTNFASVKFLLKNVNKHMVMSCHLNYDMTL